MKYFFTYDVRYQDVDDTRRLRLNKLEEYLLDVAGRVANDLGFGTHYLLQQNLTWVLTHMNIEIDMLPTHGQQLGIETWIESNAHMLSCRNFRIYLMGEDKQLIGICKSMWAVLELTQREIVNIFDQPVFDNSVDGEVLSMSRATRPMPISEPTGIMPYTIRYSDLDYNCHCNSCQYLEILLDAYHAIPEGKIRIDLNYVKEVTEGQAVEVLYQIQDDSVRYQMRDSEGKSNCFATIKSIQ